MTMPSVIALVPARGGSKRVPGKNVKRLGAHPLLAYTIAAARESGVFAAVHVSTESAETAEIAKHYGAEVPFLRPPTLAADHSPDIDWIEHTLQTLRDGGRQYDAFSILRPTNPFRSAVTITRAWREFLDSAGADSLRAVEKCKQHPGKMWIVRGARMFPVIPVQPDGVPWHSTPYQALPEVFVQTAALEIAWSRCVWNERSITGTSIMPFMMSADESHDINDPADWTRAEYLATSGILPTINQQPFEG